MLWQWGSVEMARQLYSEQRGVDIGVAMYMKQKADTEKRGSGASLGPVQRVLVTRVKSLFAGLECAHIMRAELTRADRAGSLV